MNRKAKIKKTTKEAVLKNSLRTQFQQGIHPFNILNKNRETIPAGFYKKFYDSYKIICAPISSKILKNIPYTFNELILKYPPLSPLSLQKELYWATSCIIERKDEIQNYLIMKNVLESAVLKGEYESAITILHNCIESFGYSFCFVELMGTLEYELGGKERYSQWMEELESEKGNTLNDLLLEIFNDRCDENLSIFAFYSKCENSFPRISNLKEWVPIYLEYRALGNIKNPLEDLPILLSREATSSLIDYYELLIDAIVWISYSPILKEFNRVALDTIDELIIVGINDHRLEKLKVFFSDEPKIEMVNNVSQPLQKLLYFIDSEDTNFYEDSLFLQEISSLLKECQIKGSTNTDALEQLIKIGLNFKSLDLGTALTNTAIKHLSYDDRNTVINLGTLLYSKNFIFEDIAAYPTEIGIKILHQKIDEQNNDANAFRAIINNDDYSIITPNVCHIWIGYYFLQKSRFIELEKLLDQISYFGGFWEREVDKIRILSLIEQNDLLSALNIINHWILKNPMYINEFPFKELFKNKKWKEFKSFDPVKVGLVAHYASEGVFSQEISFICKSSCRKFLNEYRDNLINVFQERDEFEKN